MKVLFTTLCILFFTTQLFAQPTITIINNQPNSVLIELGWNDNSIIPFFSSYNPHMSDFQCIPAFATITVTPALMNWDILKGFKIYCPFGGCTMAQSYTDMGPWSGDPGVAPIWHSGFSLPTGSINHFDCASATLIGTVDWNSIPGACPFPYEDYVITIN